jgi:hypothetical protein
MRCQHYRDVAEALIFGNLAGRVLHVRWVKNGTPSAHPLTGRERRELRRHQRESAKSPFVIVSERGGAVIDAGFQPHDRAGSCNGQARH